VAGAPLSPRVAIAEGAHFRGSVDMQRKGGAATPAGTPKPATAQAAAPEKNQPQSQGAPQRVGA
jgi:hypothetical protein